MVLEWALIPYVINCCMNKPISRFAPLTEDLIEQVRMWRNKPRIRSNMINDYVIGYSQQRTWFRNISATTSEQHLVFFQNDRPIGMLYFSDISSDSCKWGCYLGEENIWPGSGILLFIAALDYAFDVIGVCELCAEVFEDNYSSVKLDNFFGYEYAGSIRVSTFSNVSKNLLQFSYEKDTWLLNRPKIIDKLPRRIREATKHIMFS